MKIQTVSLFLACTALLAGCATKDYVNEQIASLNQRLDRTDGQTATLHQGLENRIGSQQTALEGISRTAQEALDRAQAAGKLAEGKFLYETALSSQVAKFGYDSSELSPDMKAALDTFAVQLKGNNKNVFIEIQGHTDSKGSKTYNQSLSERRASAVSGYLTGKSITDKRVTIKGFGETVPKYGNDTDEGRTQNRRVEFLISANEKMKAEAAKEAGL